MSNTNHHSHQLTLQKINNNKQEADKNFQLVFSSLQMLNQQFQAMENLFLLTLNQLDIPEDSEIKYSQEDFENKYGHLIGEYFIEKETGTFFKIDLILKDWDLTSNEDKTWKFSHPSLGEKIIVADDEYTAYDKLVTEIRNPLVPVED
tara:strand:+ start:1513 stop:1956 length:444 start_codon:yes stop_codon:yes gene_type:complete